MALFYDTEAGKKILDPRFWPPAFGEYMRLENEWLGENIKGDIAAADFGCGLGRHLQMLAPRIEYGAGVDNSPRMVALAKEALQDVSNVEIFLKDAAATHLQSEYFDYAICMNNTIGNVGQEKEAAVLREMTRVTKMGGTVVVSVHSEDSIGTKLQIYKNCGMKVAGISKGYVKTAEGLVSRQYSNSELREILAAAGLQDLKVSRMTPICYLATARKLPKKKSADRTPTKRI